MPTRRNRRRRRRNIHLQHSAGALLGGDVDGAGQGKRHLFKDYMSFEDVSVGLKSGQLIQGVLKINPKKYHKAFLLAPDGAADIFLDGMVSRNRALNGDVVVVKLLPLDQRKVLNRDEGEQLSVENRRQGESFPDVMVESQYNEAKALHKQVEEASLEDEASPAADQFSSSHNVQRNAKVVYIMEQKHSRVVSGFIKFLCDKPFALFSPLDHRVPRVNIPLSDCPTDFPSRSHDFTNTLFICRITHWLADSQFAEGQLMKSLDQVEAMLIEFDVDFSEFTAEELACLPQGQPWTIPTDELKTRRDLRKECIFTIDPAKAQVLDDALSCKQRPNGNFELGVHIADVSYFVKEGNALDNKASRRAVSLYLEQKVIPMLPHVLCEELCSLNPQTDRLTFSVIWTLSPEWKILSKWLGRSVIRSCVKLSYDHAQSMMDFSNKEFGAHELPPVSPEHSVQCIHLAILDLEKIATHLRAQRIAGRSDQDCNVYQCRDSKSLVEEFMVLANMPVARKVYNKNKELALLRCQSLQSHQIMKLQNLCDHVGLNIDMSSAGALHRSLEEAINGDELSPAQKAALKQLCATPMLAGYCCSGVLRKELFFHQGLNVNIYTHFTASTRRYADIIVHRLLAASLKRRQGVNVTKEELQRQASYCNAKYMASKRVQELSLGYLVGSGPLNCQATVNGIKDKSFDVLLRNYRVKKRIYCDAVEGLQKYEFCKVEKCPKMTLVWKPNMEGDAIEQEISLFSLVDVQLTAREGPLKYTAVLMRLAVKSCLICMVSYCKTHLEPHERVSSSKKHKLMDPVENLEDYICQKHGKPLELFCRDDQTCVCQFCAETDHKSHNTVPLEEEIGEKKVLLGKTQEIIQQMIQERLKKIKEIKHSKITDVEKSDFVKIFSNLKRCIERSQAYLLKVMEEEQKATDRQADELFKELKQEMTKLKRRNTELEQLSHTEDHLHLLQVYPSLCSPPHTQDWTDRTIITRLSVETLRRRALSQRQDTLNQEIEKIDTTELRRIQQYAVDVTLDPDTAHPNLILSDDGKQVTCGDTRQNLPDNPERFNRFFLVLGKEGFSSGRFYYEVQVRGKTDWDLGVTKESINRKENFTLRPYDGVWCVRLSYDTHIKAMDYVSIFPSLKQAPQKVGVFVDYEEGLISFYDVDAMSHIYSFTGQTFTEKLYPCFCPCLNDEGKNSAPLIICPVSRT